MGSRCGWVCRATCATIALLGVASAALAEAPRWVPGGIPVGSVAIDRAAPVICSSGHGGCVVAWQEDFGTYVQCLTGFGTPDTGWSALDGSNASPGAPVAPYMQESPRVASDAAGGAFVIWHDERDYGCHYECWSEYTELYASHMTHGDSVASGWTPSGQKIGSAMNYMLSVAGDRPGALEDFNTVVAPDGAGGVLSAWHEHSYPMASGAVEGIHAQRVSADGRLLWGPRGVLVSQATGLQVMPALVPTGDGGAVVIWQDSRDDTAAFRLYGQRLAADGTVAWTADGVPLSTGTVRNEQWAVIAGIDHGEVSVGWLAGVSSDSLVAMAQRLDVQGRRVWPSDVRLSGGTGGVSGLAAGQDVDGSTWFGWVSRTPAGAAAVLAQRLTRLGTPACGWNESGSQVRPTSSSVLSEPRLVPSSLGGAFVAWLESGLPVATRVTESGSIARGWPVGGLSLSTSSFGTDQLVAVADGEAGVLVSWEEGAMPTDDYAEVKLQRLSRNGIWDDESPLAQDLVPDSCAVASAPILEGFLPNPVRSAVASVAFELPVDGSTRIELFDIAGRRVADLQTGFLAAGRHVVEVEASRRAPPGVYFVRMTQGTRSATARGVILP